ncbi:MAG: hypothetical protein LBR10_12680 [Prevotellaceae bacterium]|jgi:tetratricopeptide (TPR) repeat protein|nr:hypothetical protein [Prevotellaceae bacterium]
MDGYFKGLLIFILIIAGSQPVAAKSFAGDIREDSDFTRFAADSSVEILESKKANDRMFSKYKKDNSIGLILTYKGSIVFINNNMFSRIDEPAQTFDFADSATIVFRQQQDSANRTIAYKYIFQLEQSQKWILRYAEKKVTDGNEQRYVFTDNFKSECSMDKFSMDMFDFEQHSPCSYVFRQTKYLDSILIQVKNMRAANVESFENVFNAAHAEELLRHYPITPNNVTRLNNIAYYLEQMSIATPAIVILEDIVAEYPNRTVSYLNLGDALTKKKLTVKAKKIYKQYISLMKSNGKANEIPKRLSD